MPSSAIEAIARALAAADDDEDASGGLWPVNAEIAAAFLAVDTQWRVVAIPNGLAPGRMFVIGLDYAAVRAGFDAAGIDVTPPLWSGLQVMEAEAVHVMNEFRE